MDRLNWDKVNWRDIIKEGYGVPPLLGAVAVGEPDRKIEVQMTYADLLFIKQLTDAAVKAALDGKKEDA